MDTEFINETLYISKSADVVKQNVEDSQYHVTYGAATFIEFENLYITGIVSFGPKLKGNLSFKKCIFKDGFTMMYVVYANEVRFEECIFEGACVIENSKFDSKFLLIESKINFGLWVIGDNIFKADFRIDADCNTLNIFGGVYKHLIIQSIDPERSQRTIQKLKMNMRGVSGTIDIADLRVEDCSFGNVIEKNTSLLLHTLDMGKLTFDQVSNGGNIRVIDPRFVRVPKRSTGLAITSCNLGKTEFINLNLSTVDQVLISSSSLIECLFVNVIWPQRFVAASRFEEHLGLLDQRDTFRQIKYAYNKQGDYVTEHKFHGLELDAYRSYIRAERKRMNIFRQIYAKRQTSWVLMLSKFTSNYGQSFAAPLFSMLVVGICAFWAMISFHYIPELNTHLIFTWQSAEYTVARFMQFMNPLRRTDTAPVNGGLIIDFTMRIITSYCIYNFVRATRRFVK